MLRRLVLVPVLATVRIAAAEPSDKPQLALAVNPPLRWEDGSALAGSVYVGFAKHHVIRGNIARFANDQAVGTFVADVFFDGDGDDTIRTGRTIDAGIGYMYFPRKLWSGPTLEVGALLRNAQTRDESDFAAIGIVDKRTNTFAGRALVGWSWLFADHLFVSLAVGVSTGYERGRETTSMRVTDPQYVTHDVSRGVVTPEGFIRIGGAFDTQ